MIAVLGLAFLTSRLHGPSGVVWTKGFSFHHSQLLPSGLVLLTEDGFYSEGNRDRVRLTWFRQDTSRFKKVLAFQGITTLDDLPPKVQGDWVRVRTVDEPHVFLVSAVDNTFGQESTWRIEKGVPRLVSRNLLALRLRAVDEAIWRSWNAMHPSLLQIKLREAWPESDDLFSWTEVRNGTTWTVNVNRDYFFSLRRDGANEWKVDGFRTAHKMG